MYQTDLSLYSKFCNDLDLLVYDVCSGYDALEGLNSNVIGRLFVSIVDTFGQLANTFCSNIKNATVSVRRSELNEFVQSNPLKTRTVDGIPYEKCIDVDVDVPANMKGTYKAAVTALVQVYARLNTLNNGKLVDTGFREILNSINTRDSRLSKQIESNAFIVSRLIASSKPAIDMCLSQFESKFNYKKPFNKVFLSSQEWVDVRKTLIDNENRLQDVKALTDLVTSLEATLKQITSAVETNDTPVTPRDVKNMAEAAKGIALVFDAYGMATTRQMTLEHNYILCLNHIYDTVK